MAVVVPRPRASASWLLLGLLVARCGSLRVQPLIRSPCQPVARSSTVACSAATAARAGALLRVTHEVSDAKAVGEFYERCLGVASADGLLGQAGAGLRLELVTTEGGAYDGGGGYEGLIARVPSVAKVVAAVAEAGGAVLREEATVTYGPALVPDEEADSAKAKSTPVVEALVSDPAGYPILLYEVAGTEGTLLSGARLETNEWKKSQEWWEALGWKTVRWQSHVPQAAALTVTVAADGAPSPEEMGPRGSLADSSVPVVQLTYDYGSKPVKQKAGLGAIVLAAAAGDAGALEGNPDDYPIRME